MTTEVYSKSEVDALLAALQTGGFTAGGNEQVFRKFISWNVNICVAWTPITEVFQPFQIARPSNVSISGHVVLTHRGNYAGAVAWGLRGALRGPGATEADVSPVVGVGSNMPAWLKGCKTGDNLLSLEQHYASPAVTGSALLTASGWYRFELWANFHWSQVLPDGASGVEINGDGGAADPYNHFEIRVRNAYSG